MGKKDVSPKQIKTKTKQIRKCSEEGNALHCASSDAEHEEGTCGGSHV
jgi:hypothetical protein